MLSDDEVKARVCEAARKYLPMLHFGCWRVNHDLSTSGALDGWYEAIYADAVPEEATEAERDEYSDLIWGVIWCSADISVKIHITFPDGTQGMVEPADWDEAPDHVFPFGEMVSIWGLEPGKTDRWISCQVKGKAKFEVFPVEEGK